MMLGLRALATCLPEIADQHSLLGPQVNGAYRHLYDPAGKRSRPPTVPRGVFLMPCPAYATPTAAAEERVADLAAEAVRRVLLDSGGAADRVRSILHTQCTLDQQILGSTCLRIEHEHFRHATRTATIGQLGTAGLPTVLRLAAMDLAQAGPQALVCVSAADKWVAPFVRHVPGFVTYGDAAAALLVGPAQGAGADVATLQALRVDTQAPALDPWTAAAPRLNEALLQHAEAVLRPLLGADEADHVDGPWLFGDGYSARLTEQLALRLGLPRERAPVAQTPGHLSSASPVFALAQAVEAAVALGRDIDVLVWTASSAGHAGAMRLRCHASARQHATGWLGVQAVPQSRRPSAASHPRSSAAPSCRPLETTP
ncbi:MAG: hypothetical protein ING89_13495 [Rubrivivax sp.]|nr:hypothetical protein [Rubrivivax sp.]